MNPFQYAVLRLVPRVDREEFVNVGVIVYCQAREFLDCRTHLDEHRLRALAPGVNLAAVRLALDAAEHACHAPVGSARENTGLAARFGMLTAPRSTMLQPGPVHAGMTDDPGRTLERLMETLVG